MASKVRYVPRLRFMSVWGALRSSSHLQTRSFSACSRCRTDGVYGELSAMRTRTPFIEAFRKQQNGTGNSKPVSTETVERDLSPKTMSDSYTSVVSHVTLSSRRVGGLMREDIASSTRSMASGLIYQFFWPHTARYGFHGSRCACWCHLLQAHR
jgi:hypothetical protein